MNFKSLQKGLREFIEYPTQVVAIYGGQRFVWRIDMLWCLIAYGARPMDYVRFEFFKKNRFERKTYLTFFKYLKLFKKICKEGAKAISANKAKEYMRLNDFLQRPWMFIDSSTSTLDINLFVRTNAPVIIKPNRGEQGKGVKIVNNCDDLCHLIQELKESEYVIESLIQNCAELNILNPSSLNTLRVVTLIDREGHVHILGAWLRVGAAGKIVDNWGAGGVGYNVDLDTGIIDRVGKDKLNRSYIYHPGSNILMLGYKIPRFEEIKNKVKEMALKIPEARYVGWDIAITPMGIDLVEMNCPPGHDMMQSLGGGVMNTIKLLW